MKKYKRYEHIMWDGIYDNYNDPNHEHELSFTQIVNIMNDRNNEIQVWKNKYDEMKKKYKSMENKAKFLLEANKYYE